LPVIERELIVAARKPWTARTRIVFALAGVVTCLMVMAVPRMPTHEQGIMMLVALSILSLAFALFSGCFLTADCISREKREGTLGLLFLTPLRYRDIALGKLVSSSVLVAYGLLAVFPVFFLPLLNGGVTWAEVLRVLLTLLVTLSLSLTVGLFCSTLCNQAKTAVLATFVVMLLVTLLPLLYLIVLAEATRGQPSFLGPPQWSPAVLLLASFDQIYQRGARHAYWIATASQLVLSLGLLLLSVKFLARRWAHSKSSVTSAKHRAIKAGAECRVQTQPLLPNANPYAWAASRDANEPVLVLVFRGLMLALIGLMIVWCATSRRSNDEAYVMAFLTAYALHLTSKFSMALEATRPLSEDRQSGALELVLITPMGARQTLPGAHEAYRQATRRSFRWLIRVNLTLLAVAIILQRSLHMQAEALTAFAVLYLGGIVMAFADRRAMAWVGFRQSLVARTHLRAALMTLAHVMVPGWLMFAGAVLALINARSATALTFVFAFWFVCCLLHSLLVIAHGHTSLPSRFRELAASGSG
jgi:ABC-type transport system involved in multi-copper enzyme maturation permease subunit